MRPIEQLSNGTEEAQLERIEEILYSAADFQPEAEATYNFAAAAMARRRFRSRAVWMALGGCACTALLVWWAVPRMMEPLPNVLLVGAPKVEDSVMHANEDDSGATGSATYSHIRVPENLAAMADTLRFRPKYTPADHVRFDPVNHSDSSDQDDEAGLSKPHQKIEPAAKEAEPLVPKAKWETETVDRYASGVIKPTYVEERNPDGTRVRKPAFAVIPLESGERPAASGSGDMGVLSLANYDAGHKEAAK